MLAAKMNRMAARKMLRGERRDRDPPGAQLRERRMKPGEILRIAENQKVDVPAKLGRAVLHAGLPPISSARTRCFWKVERTLRIGFGIKVAS